ncbi:winged helix-turn-helix domain-containing protein [Methanolobus sp. WCC4]|uniref:helix-turn-helix transcriptional regulator n=1 Tax=Methanolobus sp. WCC4 TaxID=3125784 RepID=UPI0030F4D41F
MKKELNDVLFASEKRKNVLLSLQNGPQEMDHLLKSLETTRQALLPQIKILEEHHLVDHKNDIYKLTTIGKLIVEKMVTLVNTVETFDTDIDYWGTHYLDFIPQHLLSRISEIGKTTVISIPPVEQYDTKKLYHEKSKESSFNCSVTTLLYPNYHDIFTYLIENDIKTNVIVSESLLEKICSDYRVNFESYIKTDVVNIYVYKKKMGFLFFTYDDFFVTLYLLRKNEELDSKFIRSGNENALKWAEELFDYYLENSVPVTEL